MKGFGSEVCSLLFTFLQKVMQLEVQALATGCLNTIYAQMEFNGDIVLMSTPFLYGFQDVIRSAMVAAGVWVAPFFRTGHFGSRGH